MRPDRTRITVAATALLLSGCTAESTRLALVSQQRADDVQQHIFDSQQHALRTFLFGDLVGKLAAAGAPLDQRQQATLNDAWNERDLLEFWAVQNERAKALRRAGVDAKLFGDQATIDLMLKAIAARAARIETAQAASAGRAAADRAARPGAGASDAAVDPADEARPGGPAELRP
jgi:hypothetical protein